MRVIFDHFFFLALGVVLTPGVAFSCAGAQETGSPSSSSLAGSTSLPSPPAPSDKVVPVSGAKVTPSVSPLPPDAAAVRQLQQDFFTALRELELLLNDVRDKESADAAATRAGEACSRILRLTGEVHLYAQADDASEVLLERGSARSGRSLEELAKAALTGLLTVYFHNCYDSESFREAVRPFMEEMMSGADALNSGDHDVPDVVRQEKASEGE